MDSIRLSVSDVGGERRVVVGVRYDQRMVLSDVVGARFDRSPRPTWSVPATGMAVVETMQALRALGMGITTDDAVIDIAASPWDLREMPEPDPALFALCVRPPRATQRLLIDAIGRMPGVGVGLGMGGGKTKIVFDAAVCHSLYRVLVSCPLSVCRTVWERQTEDHVHPSVRGRWRTLVLDDRPIKKRAEMLGAALARHRPGDWLMVVVNHEAVWRGALGELVASLDWDLAAVDESHRIKDSHTKQCEFLARKVAPRARRRVCLTGTPLGQGPLDAFGQCLFLDQSVFGSSFTRFRDRYAVTGGKFSPHQVVGYKNVEAFRDRFFRIWSVVPTSEIVELPDVVDDEVVVTLPPDVLKAYNSLRDEMIAEVRHEADVVERIAEIAELERRHGEDAPETRLAVERMEASERYVVVAGNALVKMIRLQQMTSGFAAVERDGGGQDLIDIHGAKREALTERLEFVGMEPTVVFARFTRDIHNICRAAEALGRPFHEITGQAKNQPAWERDADAGLAPVLGVQIQAGGVGIDLTRARYGWYYSATHSLIDYQQSRCRMHRPGQAHKVRYEHIMVAGTIDRLIYRALARNENVVSYVLRSSVLGRLD